MSDKQDSETMLLRPLFLLLVYFSLAFTAIPVHDGEVKLTWDVPLQADGKPIPNLQGYVVYYGLQSGQYSSRTPVGMTTTAHMSNLSAGQTYYFSVKAYDITGTESAFSKEWSITLPESDTMHVQGAPSILANTPSEYLKHVQGAPSILANTPSEYTNNQSDIEKKGENTKKPGAPSQSFPDWAPVAGGIVGVMTILFLMLVAILAIFGYEVPPTSRFPVVAVIAFGFAMAVAFVGGNAAAKGNLPLPGLQDKPIDFSVAGGIATFLIVLFVANFLYAKHDPNSVVASK